MDHTNPLTCLIDFSDTFNKIQTRESDGVGREYDARPWTALSFEMSPKETRQDDKADCYEEPIN